MRRSRTLAFTWRGRIEFPDDLPFIHSSDLHLGKRFGSFSDDLPAKLREARHAMIGRLGEHAQVHGASTTLLADGTFDIEIPSPEVRLRQQVMVRLVAGGRAQLEVCTTLAYAMENARPDFTYFEFDDEALITDCEAALGRLYAYAKTVAPRRSRPCVCST